MDSKPLFRRLFRITPGASEVREARSAGGSESVLCCHAAKTAYESGCMRTDPNLSQKQHELAVFRRFVEAYRSFGVQVEYQPASEEPADILAKLENGDEIGFQLGEWLEPSQAATAKRKEKLRTALQKVLSASSPEEPRNLACVAIEVKGTTFQDKDADEFKNDFSRLISEVDQGCQDCWAMTEFSAYPTLQKYVLSVLFSPRGSYRERIIGENLDKAWSDLETRRLLLQFHEDAKTWAEAQGLNISHDVQAPRWIQFATDGGASSSENAIQALTRIIGKKISHYGKSESRDIRLVIYYDEAVLYNSPYHDQKYERFEDVAQEAARFLAKKTFLPFTKIYLLNALSPGPKAFEVWPALAKCE